MLFQTISALVVATAFFSWFNQRFLKLPSNVALLIMGLGAAIILLGLEVLILNLHLNVVLNGLLAIPVVLAVRYIAVRFSMLSVGQWLDFGPGTPVLLTWSAIRGAISAALALALPASDARPFILAGAYAVIVFSVVVQTLTLPRLVRHYAGRSSGGTEGGTSG